MHGLGTNDQAASHLFKDDLATDGSKKHQGGPKPKMTTLSCGLRPALAKLGSRRLLVALTTMRSAGTTQLGHLEIGFVVHPPPFPRGLQGLAVLAMPGRPCLGVGNPDILGC